MLVLTNFKFLTALVSSATAITLITLIPLLLKVKVRELFLKKKAWELNRQVGKMKKLKEASLHVRELTQEIRKSLDSHAILYTTLLKLSNTLDLQNCTVWIPNDIKTEMNLTHELKGRSSLIHSCPAIPINDPDVKKIKESKGVKILRPDSALGIASSGGFGEPGAVVAIRMPMLWVANFNGGTPELIPQCYAILVLVLPNTGGRVWTCHELEIVEVVADQVAVALSHAAVLEESQLMRDKLAEQYQALQQVREKILILGLLPMIRHENLSSEQQITVESMLKTSIVLSTLINDAMGISSADNGRFPLEMRSFQLAALDDQESSLSCQVSMCL
uniref:GAF domain-containing protein n=1 Tax=Nelumbo nucifera TaxID=4432 RepID=A0A822Y537_NELNU|nr:TPA_asm: hypothetical protein HUJ06_029035 [Nelumbo nucifera]